MCWEEFRKKTKENYILEESNFETHNLCTVYSRPLMDAQSCLPSHLFPAPLLDLKKWYSDLYSDYLGAMKPLFFVGLIWVEILFVWPLSLANLDGIVKGRSWSKTTSLMAGVCAGTSMINPSNYPRRNGMSKKKII